MYSPPISCLHSTELVLFIRPFLSQPFLSLFFFFFDVLSSMQQHWKVRRDMPDKERSELVYEGVPGSCGTWWELGILEVGTGCREIRSWEGGRTVPLLPLLLLLGCLEWQGRAPTVERQVRGCGVIKGWLGGDCRVYRGFRF